MQTMLNNYFIDVKRKNMLTPVNIRGMIPFVNTCKHLFVTYINFKLWKGMVIIMKLLLHDLSASYAGQYLSISDKQSFQIVGPAERSPVKCIGCFGCWIKTPGECVLKDGFNHMGEYLGNCEAFTIITQSRYGEFSCFIKNILDRSISTVHPYFVKRQGEIHHKLRYQNHPGLQVICYSSDLSEEEKNTFENRVKATAVNLGCSIHSVTFINGLD